jgi:hypothetical protein
MSNYYYEIIPCIPLSNFQLQTFYKLKNINTARVNTNHGPSIKRDVASDFVVADGETVTVTADPDPPK